MTEFVNQIENWTWNSWVNQVFAVVFITLVVAYIQRVVFKKILARLQKTKNPWDDALVGAIRKPLTLLIWVLGLSLAISIAQMHAPSPIFNAVPSIRDVLLIAIVAWFLLRFIRAAENNAVQKKRKNAIDETTVHAIGKLLRLAVVITAGLVILQNLGYSITGVLAFGGVGGIAVGFAAKDLLANLFGGLMIFLDRPFAIGDWIRSPDREIEGTVEHIGWRVTRIRTFDKRPLYVPNSVFTTIAVENPSRMSNRRIKETIGIRYDDAEKMDVIIKDVKQMLIDHEEIDNNQTLIVNFNAFAPSSLDFFIYTFTKTTNWIRFHEIKQDVLLRIEKIIRDHGAECAFPTSTLHVPDELKLASVNAES